MTDRENLCIADNAAGRTPAKRASAGEIQEDGRWNEELCSPQADEVNVIVNFSTLCKSDKRDDIHVPTGSRRADMSLLFTKSELACPQMYGRNRGASYCKPARAPFLFATPRYIHSRQLYVNFDECSMYSN